MSDSTTAEANFERSLSRLEELVDTLENDELNLDEALEAYEEGVGLARRCRERLDAAEMRVQELSLED